MTNILFSPAELNHLFNSSTLSSAYIFNFWLVSLLDFDSICSYKQIVEFIDTQFEAYLQEELKIKRTLHSYHDSRIHACLYFIAPTGHSLKSLDLVTMKKLDSKVSADLKCKLEWCLFVYWGFKIMFYTLVVLMRGNHVWFLTSRVTL